MSWPTLHFKNILSEIACAQILGIVEYVPLIPAVSRDTLDRPDFRAVRNLASTLPSCGKLGLVRHVAAIDGSDLRRTFREQSPGKVLRGRILHPRQANGRNLATRS